MSALNVISTLFVNYSTWLLASECFEKFDNQDSVIKSLDTIKTALHDAVLRESEETAILLYGSVVDHLHETGWHWDESPELFQDLYDAIDQYRTDEKTIKLWD